MTHIGGGDAKRSALKARARAWATTAASQPPPTDPRRRCPNTPPTPTRSHPTPPTALHLFKMRKCRQTRLHFLRGVAKHRWPARGGSQIGPPPRSLHNFTLMDSSDAAPTDSDAAPMANDTLLGSEWLYYVFIGAPVSALRYMGVLGGVRYAYDTMGAAAGFQAVMSDWTSSADGFNEKMDTSDAGLENIFYSIDMDKSGKISIVEMTTA